MQTLYISPFSHLGLLEFPSIPSGASHLRTKSTSRSQTCISHLSTFITFYLTLSILYLIYLALSGMASFRQSPTLRFYSNGRQCCSSGPVYQEEAPTGSGTRSSNQASFANAPPNGPAVYINSSINSATVIAHQSSKSLTVPFANWLTVIHRRLWVIISGAICGPRKLS